MPEVVTIARTGGSHQRRIQFVINPQAETDLVAFLEGLPRGSEAAWWRGVANRWLEQAKRGGNLNQELVNLLNEFSPYCWTPAADPGSLVQR